MRLRYFGWAIIAVVLAIAIVFGSPRIRDAALGGMIGGAALGAIATSVAMMRFALRQRPRGGVRLSNIRLYSLAPRYKLLFAILAALVLIFPAFTERPGDHVQGAWTLLTGVDDADVEAAFRAAVSGDVTTLTRSLRRGVSSNVRNRHGDPLLYVASANGNTAAAQTLIRFGAEPDRQRRAGRDTPLHVAVQICRVELVKLLIGAGANPCIANGAGEFPASKGYGCTGAGILQVFKSMDALATACKGRSQPNPFDTFDEASERKRPETSNLYENNLKPGEPRTRALVEQRDRQAIGSQPAQADPLTISAALIDAPHGALELSSHDVAYGLMSDPKGFALTIEQHGGLLISGNVAEAVRSTSLPRFTPTSPGATSIAALPLLTSMGAVQLILKSSHPPFELKAGQPVRAFCPSVGLVWNVLGDCALAR